MYDNFPETNYGEGINSFIYSPKLPDYAFNRLGICVENNSILNPRGVRMIISQGRNDTAGGLHVMDIYIYDKEDFVGLIDKLIKEYDGIYQSEYSNKTSELIFIIEKRQEALDWLESLVMISKLTK
jgi:hypothetical protein